MDLRACGREEEKQGDEKDTGGRKVATSCGCGMGKE